jgi:hypothetical protein
MKKDMLLTLWTCYLITMVLVVFWGLEALGRRCRCLTG